MNPEVMDLGLIRGIITVVLLAAFIGMVFWAYSKRRENTFDEASRLPLEDNWETEGNQR